MVHGANLHYLAILTKVLSGKIIPVVTYVTTTDSLAIQLLAAATNASLI
ncbi:hypothetical protein ACYSNU_06155 [Enterococcus sp. LJL120]